MAGKVVGYLGQAGAALSGLRSPASVAEIDFDAIVKAAKLVHPYKDFKQAAAGGSRSSPSCSAEATTWKQVETAVRWGGPRRRSNPCAFLNEYKGKGIDPGHKSWAFFDGLPRAPTGPSPGRKSTPPSRAF